MHNTIEEKKNKIAGTCGQFREIFVEKIISSTKKKMNSTSNHMDFPQLKDEQYWNLIQETLGTPICDPTTLIVFIFLHMLLV